MIKKLIMVMVLMSVSIFAIEDVDKKDASYDAIKWGVENGYFSTFENGQKFYPERQVTRQEMALILTKVIERTNSNQPLSLAERQELGQLAKTFKSYLVQQKLGATEVGQKFGQLKTEQDVLHHDLTSLQVELDRLEAANKKQKNWIWAALGIAILGVVI